MVEEIRNAVNIQLEFWTQTFETNDFHLTRNKAEYMHCNYCKRQEESDVKVKMGEDVIPQLSKFKYLGLIL